MIKKSGLLVLLYTFLGAVFVFAQERISVLDGKLSFQRPENVLLRSEMPKMTQTEEEEYTDGKVVLGIVVENEEDLRVEYSYNISEALWDLLQRESNFTRDDYLSLLNTDTCVLSQGSPASVLEIYKLLYYYNKPIGEMCGYAQLYEGSFVSPSNYGLYFVVVVDKYLVHISLRLSDASYSLPPLLPQYFYYNSELNEYWWKERLTEPRAKLFQQLLSKDYKELPESLRFLRESWDMVLNTLEIPEYWEEDSKGNQTSVRIELRPFEPIVALESDGKTLNTENVVDNSKDLTKNVLVDSGNHQSDRYELFFWVTLICGLIVVVVVLSLVFLRKRK
jgi:hypothetical protein